VRRAGDAAQKYENTVSQIHNTDDGRRHVYYVSMSVTKLQTLLKTTT